jgi:small-conductance mechanosensitive channel
MATFVGRGVRNLFILAGLVYALLLLDVRVGPLLGALGIVALALAFGAQAIFQNLFASIVLRTRRPIRRGDQITTDDVSGTCWR